MPLAPLKQIVERLRRHAQEQPQRVEPLVELYLKLRDRQFGLPENILGLVDRQLARDAAGVPVPGDLQGLALFYDVFARDLDLTLGRADADIGCRDVAEQRHQHVVIGRDRGEIGGIGQFDAAAELAPEIKFPEDREAERVAPEIALAEPGRKRVGAAFPDIG